MNSLFHVFLLILFPPWWSLILHVVTLNIKEWFPQYWFLNTLHIFMMWLPFFHRFKICSKCISFWTEFYESWPSPSTAVLMGRPFRLMYIYSSCLYILAIISKMYPLFQCNINGINRAAPEATFILFAGWIIHVYGSWRVQCLYLKTIHLLLCCVSHVCI